MNKEIEIIKSELNENEISIWDRVMTLLDTSILIDVDYISLADYCREKAMYYQYFEAVKELPNDGIEYSKTGSPYQHPLIGMCNKKKELCEKFEHKFGFSPNSRNIFGYEKKEKGKETKLSKLSKPGMKKVK